MLQPPFEIEVTFCQQKKEWRQARDKKCMTNICDVVIIEASVKDI